MSKSFFVIAANVALAFLVGCTKSQENSEAKLTGDGSVVLAVNFGSVPLSGIVERTLTFTNPSSEPTNDIKLTMSDARLTFKGGTYPGEGGTCGASLAPSASCNVVIQFAATLIGAAAVRGVTSNNGVNIEIRIEFEQGGKQKYNLISALINLQFNHPPVAKDRKITLIEDTATMITLEATDPDGNALDFKLVSSPKGTISGTLPEITYTPKANFNGVDSFTFKANDGKLDSNIAVVNLTYSAENDAPESANGTLVVTEDISGSGTLNASDADGDALAFSITTNGRKGTAVITNAATGAYSYYPNQNQNGTDTFMFKATDGIVESNLATVTVTINPVNDPPIASNLSVSVTEDTPRTGTLLASDPDGDALTFSIVQDGTKGSAVVTNAATGAFTYTPKPNANGTDSFTFKAASSGLFSNTATVNVTIAAVNDAPVATAGNLSVTEDVVQSGILVASDVDGNPLTFSIVTNGSKGTVVLTNAATGSFTYTPNPNVNGPDSFTFKATDGVAQSNTATISVSITKVNDSPVASNLELLVTEDTRQTGTLLGSDADGDPLNFSIVSQGKKGLVTVSNSATGAFTYTPNPNANGTDEVTFRVIAGNEASNIATLTVSIEPVNDPPVATSGSLAVTEDIAKNGALQASDVDGEPVTFSIVTNGSKGNVVITDAAAGAFTYTPNPNANGVDTFTFRASDGTAQSNLASVTVSIAAVSDLPIAVDSDLAATEDLITGGTLLGSDPDGFPIRFAIATNGMKGTAVVTNAATGAFTYTPKINENGTDSFTFKVESSGRSSNLATVRINITPVNDAPTVSDQEVSVVPNTAATFDLSAIDVDRDAITLAIVSPALHGTIQLTGRQVIYTPQTDYFGVDFFTFKASDGMADSNVATVRLNVPSALCVNPSNATFAAGNGTAQDPYLICTPRQFYNIRETPTSHFILGSDFDFGPDPASFSAIPSFSGKLDGNNFRVTNSSTSSLIIGGLFLETSGASVSNLRINKIRNMGSGGGTLIKTAANTTVTGIRIDGCGDAESGTAYAGMIGFATDVTIVRSEVSCTVFGSAMGTNNQYAYAGGFVGRANSLTVKDSIFSGSVRASATQYATAGGFVAEGGMLTISNSRVHILGSITASTSRQYAYAGGFVGCIGCNSTRSGLDIQNSYVSGGTVSATAAEYANAGGVVGRLIKSISNSSNVFRNVYTASAITVNGEQYIYAGSLIGRAALYPNSGSLIGGGGSLHYRTDHGIPRLYRSVGNIPRNFRQSFWLGIPELWHPSAKWRFLQRSNWN